MKFRISALLSLSLVSAAGLQLSAQTHTPKEVAISPDGKEIAWTVRSGEGTSLHMTELADPDPAKDKIIAVNGTTNCAYENPVWSPNGAALGFLSSCTSTQEKPGQKEVFLWSKATGETRELSHVSGNLDELAWSPDGKEVAFLFVEAATRKPGGESAQDPNVGVIGAVKNSEVQRVYGVDTEKGRGAWLSPASLHVYHFAWAPNSHELVYTAATPPGENNWWIAQLYTQALGGSPVSVFDPAKTETTMRGLQMAVPRWSPDGKKLAFVGGLMSDEGVTGGDVWVVDAKRRSEPVDVTPGLDGTAKFLGWIGDDVVGFVEDRRGHTVLSQTNVAKRELVSGQATDFGEVSISGGEIEGAISYTQFGQVAFVKSGFMQAPEVWAGDLDKLKQITHWNNELTPASKTESVEWVNEGFHVQGWLTYPTKYDPKKKYPLIVDVHGGPSYAIPSHWEAQSLWPAEGYFLFQPNPRGSFGQGEAFVQANRKDFGYGDLRDILAGMDAVEAKVSIDKDREGLTGWSYGGFMTMFAVTQTHRFRAAIAGAGISDWQSYYGENSIDEWMIPFFGSSVYDDPAVYAKSSAMTFIKQAKTPMLILVGERDGECPAPQSFEMWHGLKDLGVKTELVVYPNEGHGFVDPDHIRDRNERMKRWFRENMPETGK